jgi:hypothetical protein
VLRHHSALLGCSDHSKLICLSLLFLLQSSSEACTSLVQLLSEDDVSLVQTLLQLTVMAASTSRAAADRLTAAAAVSSSAADVVHPAVSSVLRILHPYSLLTSFLSALSFSHSLLLDLLLGDETSCLQYLHLALRMLADDPQPMQQLQSHCADIDQLMSCLIRLHLALQRLVDKVRHACKRESNRSCCGRCSPSCVSHGTIGPQSLFPYPIRPLMRQLERLESAYEAEPSADAKESAANPHG